MTGQTAIFCLSNVTAEVGADRWVALVNPFAGRLHNRAVRDDLVRRLRAVCIDVFVSGSADAEFAQALGNKDTSGVVVCGGDGTVYSALNSMDLRRQRLAVVPCGRGNSVARDLGIGTLDQALAALRERRFQKLDAIQVSLTGPEFCLKNCVALNGVAFGALPTAIRRANALRHLGEIGYALGGISNWPSPAEYEVDLDHKTRISETLGGVTVLNTRHLGRYIPIAGGNPTDRKLEVLFQSPSFFRAKMSEISLVAGFGIPDALAAQSASVSVRCNRPDLVYVDGEVIAGVTRARLTCLAAAVTCLTTAERL